MERKPLRLPDYDYSRAGVYFLTLCAKDKAPLFGEVCVGGGVPDAPHVELSPCGAAVQGQLEEMAQVYGHASLIKYVVMPNHVHILLQVHGPSGTPAPTQGDGNGPSGTPAPTRANQTVPAFVSALKRMTNRCCAAELWQRGYYDHVIRNDADLLRIWNYIDTNPAKWAEDEYFMR